MSETHLLFDYSVMLFLFLIASAYKAYAVPTPLSPEVFSTTPLTFLFGRSPCNCGPQDRTLFEVIRSCILTIFACVYTSLHPNIPDPKASKWQKILRRLKMAFYMLIAPEAVIWWAMRQWYGAREIARTVNSIKPELNWTTTHGHFAQMGGLEGVFPDGHREVIDPWDLMVPISGKKYLTRGLVDPNELKFPKEQVEDSSKGDFLSKGLVALQTSWFVLECIARFQQHLPITEVEVVTLAFAVLNIITYGLWWDKPLNVNCQVQVHIQHDPLGWRNGSGWRRAESSRGGGDIGQTWRGMGGGQIGTLQVIPSNTKERVGIWKGLVVRPFLALILPIKDLFTCQGVKNGASHVPMFYALAFNDLAVPFQIRLITCLIGIIFGGIHFIAWDSHFPTHIELILWRTSSFVIVAVPFLVALFGIMAGKKEWYFLWDFDKHGFFPIIFELMKVILYCLGPILYILARISLVVLAFLSLRDVPPGVLQPVTWTSYIPHL